MLIRISTAGPSLGMLVRAENVPDGIDFYDTFSAEIREAKRELKMRHKLASLPNIVSQAIEGYQTRYRGDFEILSPSVDHEFYV